MQTTWLYHKSWNRKYLIGIECACSMGQILSFENCLISSLGVIFIKYCDYTDPQLRLCKCCFKEFLSNDICPFGDQIRMETTASANSSFLLQKKKFFVCKNLL